MLGEGLETPIQLIYLVTLLGFLGVGAYLVVRQVLIRRELDEAAKALGERIRTGVATCEVSAGLRQDMQQGPAKAFLRSSGSPEVYWATAQGSLK
jgi:hypothetical protein